MDTDVNINFEGNSPHQEGIISETYQRPDISYFLEPLDMKSLINTSRLVQKFLPKQDNIEKIYKTIERKALKETCLPVTVKEIKAGYFSRLYFKDLYLYLAQNKLPSTKNAVHKGINNSSKIHTARLIIGQVGYKTRKGYQCYWQDYKHVQIK